MPAASHTPSQRPVAIWLLAGCLLVYGMVVIGGITRLTGSGLSIVEWDVIMGTLPPLNETAWQEAFDKYKQYPQYHQVNPEMKLDGFKRIFWWEYIHRLWGRMLGLVFVIPFAFFLIQGKIGRSLLKKLLFIFSLGALQAVIGWFMVKSGLVDKPWVSPYRLTVHLLLAFLLFGYMWWLTMKLWGMHLKPLTVTTYRFTLGVAVLTGIQILSGGFMAGHKAALNYPTFPTMNGEWLPAGLFRLEPLWLNFLENVTTIQFSHRMLGFVILLAGLVLAYKLWRHGTIQQALWLVALLLLQVLMGILTLLYAVLHIPVTPAVLHQAGALGLMTVLLWVLFADKEKV